jgi:transposase-like protein
MGKRRVIPAEMKAKIALAALRGDRTINRIAA